MPLWKCPGDVSSCHMAARVHQSHNLNYASNSIEMKAKLEDSGSQSSPSQKAFWWSTAIYWTQYWIGLATPGYAWLLLYLWLWVYLLFFCHWSQTRLSDVPLIVQKSLLGCSAGAMPLWFHHWGVSASFLKQIFSDSFYSLKMPHSANCLLWSQMTSLSSK